jgi:hypothetical protein
MSTRGKKPGPLDLVLKSLRDSRLDPVKTRGFLRKLAHCRQLTYCGGLRKTQRFFLLSYKAPTGSEEFVPFFLSLSEARRQIRELKIGVPNLAFCTAAPAKLFNMILESGKTPCLNPGAEASRTFSPEELLELIRLAERPKNPPHTKTRAWKEYLRLKEAYSRESAEKAASRWSAPGQAPNLAQLLEVAENSLEARLSFHPQFKKSFLSLPDRENFIELPWNMLWSLANIYHIFHFSPHDFPPERLLEETGLEVLEPREKDKGWVIFDPRKKEDLRIHFRALKKEKKIMLSGLESGLAAPG